MVNIDTEKGNFSRLPSRTPPTNPQARRASGVIASTAGQCEVRPNLRAHCISSTSARSMGRTGHENVPHLRGAGLRPLTPERPRASQRDRERRSDQRSFRDMVELLDESETACRIDRFARGLAMRR